MRTISLFFTVFFSSVILSSQTKVIAHRGHWQAEGSAQNSLMSLKLAQDLGVYGSEFDVWITADDVLVLNHDPEIDGIVIETSNFLDLKEVRLSNGESLPTLEEFFEQGKKNTKVKLILELKPHKSQERENVAVAKVVELVKKLKLEEQMEYISFSLNISQGFKRMHPQVPNAYLKGNLSPTKIKEIGLDGIDYNYKTLYSKANWIKEAQELGLTVNVWTINDEDKMKEMIDLGVDFITTDKPVECQRVIDAKNKIKKEK